MPDYEESLGDQNTFDGGEQSSDRADQSLGDEATFGGNAGYVDDAIDDDMEVIDLAARYTTEGILGKGGMGEVLLATDTRLNRKVAIKRILGSAARSKTAVSRFLTEAQSIAALNHPNIVQIYDYGRAKDGPFLIMEFVEGSSLLDRCREGAIPLEEAIDLTCQLCDGLSKAHAANIVHRDIKPANVLLTEDGVPKLTDFGLAKDDTADTGMTMAGAVLGTLDFMPPEQRKDAALTDARSDLWSLAATLYQMVTGESPKVIRIKKVPAQLQDLIDKALEEAKEDRYQTANELRDALKNCLTGPESVVVAADNLGAGECPSCHTRNDSSRKFCSECAKSLRAKCLQCDHSIPVWDKICGECGGKQADLLEEKTAEYQKQKQQAEGLRGEYLFSDAIRISTELSQLEDERFVAFRDWGNSFADEVASEQERLSNEAYQHFEEAKKHRAAFDYPAAIHAMESIPEPIRSTELQGYHAQLVSDRVESEQLLVEIKEAITNRSLEGLLPKVERGLELRGDRKDLPKLFAQLKSREQRKRDRLLKREQKVLGKKQSANQRKGTAAKSDPLLFDAQGFERDLSEVSQFTDYTPVESRKQEEIADLQRIAVSNTPFHKLNFVQPPLGKFVRSECGVIQEVHITEPFEISTYPITVKLYAEVLNAPPVTEEVDRPVELTWGQAVEFCKRLGERIGDSDRYVYRLPTEAEWEYSCRAGTSTRYYFGDDATELANHAWYRMNSDGRTHRVGTKKANGWGIFDLYGNVAEWCHDWYEPYSNKVFMTHFDPRGASSGTQRVARGGSFNDFGEDCTSGKRITEAALGEYMHTGCRVVRSRIA
ncbi:protein kinase [Pirellulaceae bacterium]|nr:protein kinase [Pirellulaceae bacterium]